MRRACLFGLVASLSWAQSPSLINLLTTEMERNFRVLREKGDPPPYFLSYSVTERDAYVVSATLGCLLSSDMTHARLLDVTVRVGSPKLDNYHRLPGETTQYSPSGLLPIEDTPSAIWRCLWWESDRAYREAAERLIKIRTSSEVKAETEGSGADFSRENPSVHIEQPARLIVTRKDWENRVRRWSAQLSRYHDILTSSVTVILQQETKYLTTTEQTRLVHGQQRARILISAHARAPDGADLFNVETFDAFAPEHLPDDTQVLSAVGQLGEELVRVVKAPQVEPFAGPAILSGQAAGVFFHEIFGHRVEGHRQKDESEGQTFSKSIGTAVLPEFLLVSFDPTCRTSNGVELNGHYLYDDEGVAARRVLVVENGILKNFLMSRSPVLQFDRSNGHGRRQPGFAVVSRQSNLIVTSTRQVSEQRLREMLLEEVRRQHKPYGLYFRKVIGGYTQTRRPGAQAFTVSPVLLYRVYPDGRQDELVQGADIVGTPLTSLRKILMASDRSEVFNGYCSAESGSVPVAAVSPAVLIEEIEIQRKPKASDRPPLLPEPSLFKGVTE